MAEVRLGRQQAETGDLPEVCMRCGQPTQLWTPRKFSATSAMQSRKMLVLVPLCERHQNQWRNRIRINWLILFGLLLIAALLIFVPADWQAPLWITLGIGLPSWLIFNIVYEQLLMRAAEITDHTITLKKVSPAFIEVFDEKKVADRQRLPGAAISQKLRQVKFKSIDVRLSRREVEDDELPQNCMRCGAVATLKLPRKFSWHPEWIGTLMAVGIFCFGLLPLVLVGLILAFALNKRMKVPVPLCHAHRRHWMWKNIVGVAGLVMLAAIWLIGMIAIFQINMPPDMVTSLLNFMCAATGLGFFLWLVVMIILVGRVIKAVEITDRGITLRRASPLFLLALWEQRQTRKVEAFEEEEDEDEELPPARLGPQAGEFFDPNAPRRRHLPPEDVEELDS